MSPSTLLSAFCRMGVLLLSILELSTPQVWAQNFTSSVNTLPLASITPPDTTGCLDVPSTFIPFSSVYYVTDPNANGDRLVVGSMSLEIFSVLWSQQMPLPSTPNQQLCNPLQVAPGIYAQAYVPTSTERGGNFSDFQGLLLDPDPNIGRGFPFPGGIIPASRLPDPFAWRVRTLQAAPPTTPSTALRFIPVTPCRIFDTRSANYIFFKGQTTRDFSIPNSPCGIPFNAQAYSLNFTVVPPGKLTYLTAFPTGQQQPVASTLNSSDGRIKANAAIVPAGVNGSVSVFTTHDTHLVVDINGYFVSASTNAALAFYPVAPCRLVDTRGATGPLGAPSLSAQQERSFPVLTSACNIPTTAQAYSLNYTVVPKGPLSYLTTWPTGQTRPVVSTLNAPTGTITANSALVPAGSNGDISVYVTDKADLIIDINGYFAPPASGGLSLYNLAPCRVYDSRTQTGAQPVISNTEINVSGTCSVPASAQSYIFNATVVPTNSLLFLTLWPHGAAEQPNASALNAPDGAVTSNLAIVPTTDGSVNAFASHSTHLILDIFGYFAP